MCYIKYGKLVLMIYSDMIGYLVEIFECIYMKNNWNFIFNYIINKKY